VVRHPSSITTINRALTKKSQEVFHVVAGDDIAKFGCLES